MEYPEEINRSAQLRRTVFIFTLASLVSVSIYLACSSAYYRLGFPLDDAWIHQVYARNLAQFRDWQFLPGVRSAGSTSPLYTVLLLPGQISKLDARIWTYLLGWLTLLSVAISGYKIIRLDPLSTWKAGIWAGIFLVFEWHLVWAAVSGMETLLFACLVLLTMYFSSRRLVNWFLTGCLVGISVWIRPDGLTLLGPVALLFVLDSTRWPAKFKAAGKLCVGLVALVVLYLLFNHWSGGSYFPSTFAAKQAEYFALQSTPIWERYVAQLSLLLVGGGVLLLPGFIHTTITSFRKRYLPGIAWFIWVLGYLLLFAWRLPVTYQHGRYAIPAMVIFFVFGLQGSISLARDLGDALAWKRILVKAWVLAMVLVVGVFYFWGAKAYALDVGFIESEMVAAAHWVRQNTGADSLVAVHDIGAMGYFSERQLIDLAGLVSPEVIPMIRDEGKLSDYLNDRGADYLVVFPGWYRSLTHCLPVEYSTHGTLSSLANGENLVVYRWTAAIQNAKTCQN